MSAMVLGTRGDVLGRWTEDVLARSNRADPLHEGLVVIGVDATPQRVVTRDRVWQRWKNHRGVSFLDPSSSSGTERDEVGVGLGNCDH